MKYATSQADGKFGKLARTFSRNRKIVVRLQGTACYTDNEKLINLPANADFLSEETQHLLEGCLDHETGHCERQQQGIEERIRGNTKFPLYTEEVKKLKSAKERNLLNVYEDISLEINASKRYVGMSDNLRELNEVLSKRLAANVHKLSAWKALTCGIIGAARGFDISWVPAKVQPLLAALAPVIEKAKVETDHVGQSVKRVHETMAIIKEFAEAEPEEKDDHEGEKGEGEPNKDDAGGKDKKPSKGSAKPEESKDKDGSAGDEEEQEEHGAGDQGESEGEEEGGAEDSSGEGEEEEAGDAAGEPGDESEGEKAPGDAGEESEESNEEAPEGKGSGGDSSDSKDAPKPKSEPEPSKGIPQDTIDFAKELDEKDSDIEHVTDEINKDIERESIRDMTTTKRHFPHPTAVAMDKYKKVEIQNGDNDEYRSLLNQVRPVIAGLRSRLMLYLRGQKDEAISGDKERGHIDDQALYGLRTGDKRVFYTRTETEDINTVIGILVDQSGSMGEYNTAGLSKVQIAKQSAIAVSECLDKLGLPFGVWGFHNINTMRHFTPEEGMQYNRFKSLDVDIYKEIDEPFGRVKGRFVHIRQGGDNTDGEAVMYCIDQLRRRPETRKILIVLSDGNPLSGHSDEKALRLHLKEVVKGAVKAGVEVFGIGIMDDAVKHFYPDYTIIKTLGELPKAMFQMLRKYLMRPARHRSV